jgi:hypothetical protein
MTGGFLSINDEQALYSLRKLFVPTKLAIYLSARLVHHWCGVALSAAASNKLRQFARRFLDE